MNSSLHVQSQTARIASIVKQKVCTQIQLIDPPEIIQLSVPQVYAKKLKFYYSVHIVRIAVSFSMRYMNTDRYPIPIFIMTQKQVNTTAGLVLSVKHHRHNHLL